MIYNQNILAGDVVNAELQTIGAAVKYWGFLAIHALGYDHTRPVVRWRLDRKASFEDVSDKMQIFPGNPDSGSIPPLYEDLAIFRFDKANMDTYLHDTGAQAAVRYALGKSAIMNGTSAEEIFGTDPQDSSAYAVAMGIGKKPLWAQIGGHSTYQGFTIVPGLYIETEVVKRGDLEDGITLL